MPPKLRSLLAEQFEEDPTWDEKGSVIQNYKSFGVISNPNLLSVRSRTDHIVESDSLQVPPSDDPDSVLDSSGSDVEEDGEYEFEFVYLSYCFKFQLCLREYIWVFWNFLVLRVDNVMFSNLKVHLLG